MKRPFWLAVAGRTTIVAAFVFLADTCLYHDPYVELAGGYSIGGISPSEPCDLQYDPSKDERVYSDWTALRNERIEHGSSGATQWSLVHTSDDGVIEFDSVEAWRAARREKRAQPGSAAPGVRDVRAFVADDAFIIGACADRWFLLDIRDNWCDVFANEADWKAVARRRTKLRPTGLSDPKAWHLQTRNPWALWAYAGLGVLMLPWIMAKRRHKPGTAN